MKIQKISKDGTTEFDWVIFAQSYFYIARLACQELLDEKIEKHDKSLSNKIRLPYKISNLYVAIIFNIKHGIEVFLKSLGILDSGEYEEGHDIYNLFQNLKKKMGGKIDDQDLFSIEQLITYFYKPDFIRPKIKELYEITDVQNDIFRYPDNKAKIKIHWELIIDLFKKQDVEEIKNNLDKLLALFNKAGFRIENISKPK
jgi:hypothetical protein